MTDARLDMVALAVITDGAPAARLDSVGLAVITDGAPAARLDGVYFTVITSNTEFEPTYPSSAFWGMLQKFS